MSTNKSYLPEKGTPEADKLIAFYKTCSHSEVERLAKEYGYKNSHSFLMSMHNRLGGTRHRPLHQVKIEERHPIVELPPVNLLEYKAPKSKKGDEEIAILHCTDGHADKITKSYNKEIYKKRMATVFQSTMKIINLHRNMYPIRKLVIFNTGDNIQGENPFQGSTVGDVSMGARDQVTKLAAPTWTDIIGSLKGNFEEVEFHGVPGNHGHNKGSPETSSYDLLLYDILQAGIGREKGITINVHDEWYAIVELLGFKHFLFHGDGIPCQQGVPFFALDKKLKSWHMQYGGFRYAWCLPPDALIWRADGTVSKISNLKVNSRIIGATGKTVSVKQVIRNYFKGEMIRLKVRGIPWDIEMTPEHRVLKGRSWVKAGDVKIGDHLSFTPTTVVRNLPLGDNWYKLLGTYLAEGSVTKYNVSFGFHEKEDDFIIETQNILEELYGKRGAVYHDTKRHSKHLRVCSKEIASDLRKACGQYSYGKKLEAKYIYAPMPKQKLILDYWLKGDGYKIRNRNASIGTTVSEILARQMLMIAWRLGRHASMRIISAKKGHRESFSVYIPTGIKANSKWRRLKGLWFTVDGIEHFPYDGQVYNLMVTCKTKTEPCYVVNGMKVHNSGHFHKAYYNEVSSQLEHFMTSSLTSDDEWALKQLGISSAPSQTICGLHPRHGITWRYLLNL